MTTWTELQASNEQLRLCTARMKANRLKLPRPGTLVRVRHLAILAVVDPGRRFPLTVQHLGGALLLLVCVNMHPPEHPKGPLVDPVEFIFMGKGGALYTSGTRAAADIMNGYEVLA